MNETQKPRLRLASDAELPEHLRSRDDLVPRVFGHNAELYEKWMDWYRPLVRDGSVTSRLKEILRLRVAQLNTCDF